MPHQQLCESYTDWNYPYVTMTSRLENEAEPYTNDISSSTKNNSVVWLTNNSHVQLQQHELLNPDPYCMALGDHQSYFDLSSTIASPLSSSSAAAAAAEGFPSSELAVLMTSPHEGSYCMPTSYWPATNGLHVSSDGGDPSFYSQHVASSSAASSSSTPSPPALKKHKQQQKSQKSTATDVSSSGSRAGQGQGEGQPTSYACVMDWLSEACDVGGGAAKRKRRVTRNQRQAANLRERRRMTSLNSAFDELRTRVPTFAHEKRLSRIQTLRLAVTYIGLMTDIVYGTVGGAVTVTSSHRAATGAGSGGKSAAAASSSSSDGFSTSSCGKSRRVWPWPVILSSFSSLNLDLS